MKYTDTTTPKVLAYILLVIIAGTQLGLFFVAIPVLNKDAINNILQTLLTLTVAAVTYFVGSSSSSATKTSLAAKEEVAPLPPSPPIAPNPEPTRIL